MRSTFLAILFSAVAFAQQSYFPPNPIAVNNGVSAILFANLPAASANANSLYWVRNCETSTACVTGGGTSLDLLASNGTNWVVQQASGGTGTAAAPAISLSSNDPLLSTWHTALNNCTSQLVQWVHFGDSMSIIDFTNSAADYAKPNNRYLYSVVNALKARCGDGGTGMVPLTYTVGVNTANADHWAFTGTVTQDNAGGLGPSQTGVVGYGLTKLAAAATATFTATGDHINIYYATVPSDGLLSISIDGGAATSLDENAVLAAHLWTSGALSNASHSVVLSNNGTPVHVYAAEATIGTTGIRFHNNAWGSAATEFFGTSPATQMAFTDLIPGGVQLASMGLMTNDIGIGYAVATSQTAWANIITHEQGLSSPQPSFLAIVPPNSGISGYSSIPAYTTGLLSTAGANGASILNIQNSWGTANPAVSDPNARFSADHIHPNDKGNLDEAALLAWQLTSETPVPSTLVPSNLVTNPCNSSGSICTVTLQALGPQPAEGINFNVAGSVWSLDTWGTGNGGLSGMFCLDNNTAGDRLMWCANATGGASIGGTPAIGDVTFTGSDLHTDGGGNVYIGNNTASTSTATPNVFDMGGTYSPVAGVNPKLKLFSSGGTTYGLGVSGSQMDLMVQAGAGYGFFTAGVKTAAISPTGAVSGAQYQLGTGPTWTQGGAAPTGACSNGSLFSRTDTGALYVCQSSAWVAK